MSGAPTVRFKKLRAGVATPRYMSEGAAGMDLSYAPSGASDASLSVEPGARVAVPTGLAVEIPPGFEGQVRPRSGLARTAGVTLVNAPGTIDSDYRGEVTVLLVNLGQKTHIIAPGDRIAQLIIAPVARVDLEEVSELGQTERGAGGFGHTGRR